MVDALLDYGGQEVVDSFVMLLSMISSVYVDDFMRESSPLYQRGWSVATIYQSVAARAKRCSINLESD